MTIAAELLLTTEHLIRECYDECAAPAVEVEPPCLDPPVLDRVSSAAFDAADRQPDAGAP